MKQDPIEPLRQLIEALRKPGVLDHDTDRFETIETHISIVLLTGQYAYKFKKPVDLGFVDFSSLDKRRYYCEEELRLNRRLAPDLYLDVVAIGGSYVQPVPDQEPAIEYCVKMRQFPRAAELEQVLKDHAVEPGDFIELAKGIAAFHDSAAKAPPDSPYGTANEVRRQCLDNFETIGAGLSDANLSGELRPLRDWTDAELEHCAIIIDRRHDSGRVRECHGDLHVTNMIHLQGRIQVFDCIEFNDEFRWIDVMSEIAFLLMDLDMRGRAALGHAFLNAYLEAGGDYPGLSLLRLYRVYRSMVRAKIAYLRAGQDSGDKKTRRRFTEHIRLAHRYTEPTVSPVLVITRGFSGSGKTTLTDELIPLAGAVRVRSDVERKRLEGMSASEQSHSGIGQGLYDPSHTERTYERLAECAESILRAGLPAIVDATFLAAEQRLRFFNLAQSLNVPFRILDCQAPEDVLRQRICQRARQGRDASEADTAVLDRQLSSADPLSAWERQYLVELDTQQPSDPGQLADRLEIRGQFTDSTSFPRPGVKRNR